MSNGFVHSFDIFFMQLALIPQNFLNFYRRILIYKLEYVMWCKVGESGGKGKQVGENACSWESSSIPSMIRGG
ncbi:hypothetical protein HMPREF0083_05006 [Aneurinibacillus aneurinilyticus ATCC 12856]|uniref:Uncharacterized protein n=1 Tax=Aneurinibacillus aneurinilyticus ATCC 12856 TaxID=649747 RepID=U1WEB6_ANEAE|nr:hypothetical protein HMPREF0083_05006 [Aneurinibacillus aneurinilyticus ATCC 12856]